MRMRAAVLEEFGKPLAVQEVELAEPKAGEVLVRLEACGVCHTDMYTASGADPSGYAPTVLGHEGCGIVEKLGEGVSLVKEGDRVVTLFSPQCGECEHCLSPKTNLCIAIREEQNKGHLPDGTTRLSRGGEDIRHFMGTSTFAEYTVIPEIALAVVSPDAPGHPRGAVRLRALDRARRGDQHRQGGGGLHVRGVRRRPGRAWAPWRAAGCRAPSGSCAWTSPTTGSSWRRARAPRTPSWAATDTVDTDPRDDRRLRRRLHLRGHRQREGDAPGRGGGADGVGPVHGRRAWPGKGETLDIVPRLPDHRAARGRVVVRRLQGPRPGARSSWSSTSRASSTWTR